jgi:hypothetical protein
MAVASIYYELVCTVHVSKIGPIAPVDYEYWLVLVIKVKVAI